jgi:hypothetical protein
LQNNFFGGYELMKIFNFRWSSSFSDGTASNHAEYASADGLSTYSSAVSCKIFKLKISNASGSF